MHRRSTINDTLYLNNIIMVIMIIITITTKAILSH